MQCLCGKYGGSRRLPNLPAKCPEQYMHLSKELTRLTGKEIEVVYSCFRRICKRGRMKLHTFCDSMGMLGLLDDTFLAKCIFKALDSKDDNQLDFMEFVIGLGIMIRGDISQKIRFSFEILASSTTDFVTSPTTSPIPSSGIASPIRSMEYRTSQDGEEISSRASVSSRAIRSSVNLAASRDWEAQLEPHTFQNFCDASDKCINEGQFYSMIRNLEKTRRKLIGSTAHVSTDDQIRLVFVRNATEDINRERWMNFNNYKRAVLTDHEFLELFGILPTAYDSYLPTSIKLFGDQYVKSRSCDMYQVSNSHDLIDSSNLSVSNQFSYDRPQEFIVPFFVSSLSDRNVKTVLSEYTTPPIPNPESSLSALLQAGLDKGSTNKEATMKGEAPIDSILNSAIGTQNKQDTDGTASNIVQNESSKISHSFSNHGHSPDIIPQRTQSEFRVGSKGEGNLVNSSAEEKFSNNLVRYLQSLRSNCTSLLEQYLPPQDGSPSTSPSKPDDDSEPRKEPLCKIDDFEQSDIRLKHKLSLPCSHSPSFSHETHSNGGPKREISQNNGNIMIKQDVETSNNDMVDVLDPDLPQETNSLDDSSCSRLTMKDMQESMDVEERQKSHDNGVAARDVINRLECLIDWVESGFLTTLSQPGSKASMDCTNFKTRSQSGVSRYRKMISKGIALGKTNLVAIDENQNHVSTYDVCQSRTKSSKAPMRLQTLEQSNNSPSLLEKPIFRAQTSDVIMRSGIMNYECDESRANGQSSHSDANPRIRHRTFTLPVNNDKPRPSCSGNHRRMFINKPSVRKKKMKQQAILDNQNPLALTSRLRRQKGYVLHFGHESWNTMLTVMIGILIAVVRTENAPQRKIESHDFYTRERFKLIPEKSWKVSFYDHAPMIFSKLRKSFSIDTDAYLRSIGPEHFVSNLVFGNLSSLSEICSEGRSGAFFYFTADGRFMVKTVKRPAAKFFTSILKSYYNHMMRNPDSLLTRFVGYHSVVYRYKRKASLKLHFIVMENVFHTPFEIHRRYDLKGSWVNRSSAIEGYEPTMVLKDLDIEKMQDQFSVSKTIRDRLLEIIDKDCQFLESQWIMDYSFLVGIHYFNHPMERNPQNGGKDKIDENVKKDLIDGDLSARMTAVKTMNSKSIRQMKSEGICNTAENQLYYMGIIDILTQYNLLKRTESIFKSIFSRTRSGISCVNPHLYAERFKRFLSTTIREG